MQTIKQFGLVGFLAGVLVVLSLAATTRIYVDPTSATNIVYGLLSTNQFSYIPANISIKTNAAVTNLFVQGGLLIGETNNTPSYTNSIVKIQSKYGKVALMISGIGTNDTAQIRFVNSTNESDVYGGIFCNSNYCLMFGPSGILSNTVIVTTTNVTINGATTNISF